MKSKTTLAVAALILLCSLVVLRLQQVPRGQSRSLTPGAHPQEKERTLTVDGHTIRIEIADTDAERTLGLGERDSIADDGGMLFVFPTSDIQGIWMKGMRFSLDIIWLTPLTPPSSEGGRQKGGELVVVDMKENVVPGTFPEVFLPRASVSYVLEVKGGTAAKNGITVGSILRQN